MGGDSRRLAAVAVLIGSALPVASAEAATFPVDCSGPGALIAAINGANAATGPDTIQLAQGCTYTLTAAESTNGWYGANGLPAIASEVIIEGNGATIARSSTANRFRFFFVGADPAAAATLNYYSPGPGSLTLRNLTLTGGYVRGGSSSAGGGGAGMGGAIFNQGRVVIESSTIVANSAEGGSGGVSSFGNGGGGMATSSNGSNGGSMAGSRTSPNPEPQGGANGPLGGGAGGGAGLRVGDDGVTPSGTGGGQGGGATTGTGGIGGGTPFAASAGNASGSGGNGGGSGTTLGGAGGDFGDGGNGLTSGGGGGVGGGGGSTTGLNSTGGGGGFGGGGGWGIAGGGSGGFGGGAGSRGAVGSVGAPGFGGGAAQVSPLSGGGGAGFGGAIFNMQGTLAVRNSTLTQNSALGGGPTDAPDPGKGFGGAVFNLNGDFIAIGSTFAANTAAPNTSNVEGTAIYNLAYDGETARTARTTLRNTIVDAGTGDADLVSNRSTYIIPPNLGTADVVVGADDIVRASATFDGGTISGTALSADPLLSPLADNGGPTATMAPAPGSPAIDAGSASGLGTDQRGLARPSDLPDVVNGGDGSDIGAVELQAPAGASQAFGADTGVTLGLAKRRIPARGPVTVAVSNANPFAIYGELSGRSAKKLRRKPGGPKRAVKLRSLALDVGGSSSENVKLKLPGVLRRVLKDAGKLKLRLAAQVIDPAGNGRTIKQTVRPKLKR